MKKYFTRITKIALILVYLVIVAGALVRMTGSGMGCPDWPKCFGYYIPPTHISELTWTPNHGYKRGQVIIHNEKLMVARENFTTDVSFNEANWENYTKHDYAEFNPLHTWVEYANRLVGALAGVAVLIMAIASFWLWKQNKKITLLSWLAVFMMGFQGWLGATVVYSVLNPVKITVHMVVALLIVAVILYILYKSKEHTAPFEQDSLFKKLIIVSLLLTLVQVVLGTQVRQFVDEQVKILGYENMRLVMDSPIVAFYFHRTFSFAVFAINAWMYVRNKKLKLGFTKTSWILWLLAIEIASGIAMFYADFPFGSQSIHLVTASMLFGVQFYMILESSSKNNLTHVKSVDVAGR
jgi:cytochrome c oxidase assembly protein subunit 15